MSGLLTTFRSWSSALGLATVLVLLGSCTADAPVPADDSPVHVRAYVERADVTPGKPFVLTVEVDRREDVAFTLPDIGASIKGLVIMNTKAQVPERVGGRVLRRDTYKLKAPKAGTYLIPGVEAPWKTEDNQIGTAGTGAILIEAARRAGEEGSGEQELRDLKPVAAPDPEPGAWIAGIVIAVGCGLLALFLWRRRSPSDVTPPQVPAHELALGALQELTAVDLSDPANHPVIAYKVSAILRRYLEARFGFSAAKMTTAEVLRAMPADLAQQRAVPIAIGEVLEASDLVKFAGQTVDSSLIEGWFLKARKVIEATTLTPDDNVVEGTEAAA
jgi:hypothetical protein